MFGVLFLTGGYVLGASSWAPLGTDALEPLVFVPLLHLVGINCSFDATGCVGARAMAGTGTALELGGIVMLVIAEVQANKPSDPAEGASDDGFGTWLVTPGAPGARAGITFHAFW